MSSLSSLYSLSLLPLYLLALLVVTCTSWLVVHAIYNRYFHPLRHIPGPFWASISGLYKLYVLSKLPPRALALHRRYGPIVRIAPDLLMTNDPMLLPQLYRRDANKTPFYSSWFFGDVTVPLFQVQNNRHHAVKKAIVSECCSMKAVQRFENRFDQRIDEFCNVLDHRFASTGDRLDFAEYLRYFLSDTYCHMAYGQSSTCVADGQDVDGQINALQSVYGLAALTAVLPDLLMPFLRNPFVKRHILPRLPAWKGMSRMTSFYEEDVSRRSTVQRKANVGFLDGIWRPTHDARKPLTETEVKAEYLTFSSAALDGVAAFISPFIDELIARPEIHRRVVEELAEAESRGLISHPVAQYAEIKAHLPYFNACVLEALRHKTTVETILPRHAPATGISSHGLYIPPGTQMGASPYVIHRDTTIFGEDADEFRPERWLDDPMRIALMEKYSMTFGYGSRDCAGQNYARLEISKCSLELLRRFELPAFANRGKEERMVHQWGAVGLYYQQWLTLKRRAVVA